jgi:hypothetical protein
MRYSRGSSTYWCSSSASARAEARSCPNGFSTTTRPVRVRPASPRPLTTGPNSDGGVCR